MQRAARLRARHIRVRRPNTFLPQITWPVAAIITAVLTVGLLGSYGAGVNAYQQFPGPFVLGADGRTVSPDMISSAKWFAAHEGRNRSILTNTRTLVIFSAYADAQEEYFPQWLLFYPTTAPSPEIVHEFLLSGDDFIVVDERLATDIPIESYFGGSEPPPPSIPLPRASLDKFNHLPWLRLIHRDGNISIYRVVSAGN
jgi:hypothetical protein